MVTCLASFPGKCGVRQGDILSHYLFITCMKYFSRMLHLVAQQASFCFHPKNSSFGICHLAFTNDVLLLYRGDMSLVDALFQ